MRSSDGDRRDGDSRTRVLLYLAVTGAVLSALVLLAALVVGVVDLR